MERGKSYGFFDCKASKEAIAAELPKVRSLVNAPSALELSLEEGPERVRGDSDVRAIGRQAQESDIRYALQGRFPGASNRETKDEVVAITNQAYQSPLFKEGEEFRGEIAFEKNGRYLLAA